MNKTETKPLDYRIGTVAYLKALFSIAYRFPSMAWNSLKAARLKMEASVSLGKILEQCADKYAQRPAIYYENQTISYRQFNEAVNRYAHFLIAAGFKRGDSIAVLVENRPELLMIIGGMNKIGVIASLVNTNLKEVALKHCLNLTPGNTFIVGEELYHKFEAIRPSLEGKTQPRLFYLKDKGLNSVPPNYVDLDREILRQSKQNPRLDTPIRLKDVFAYVFTSGTTGLPKAAPQNNYQWVTSYYWFGKVTLNLNPKDVLYVTLPFYHSNATNVAWPCAFAGGAAILIRRKFSAGKFWKDVRRYKATAFCYIGELCRYLLNREEDSLDRENTIAKAIGNGLRPEIWKHFKQRFQIKMIYEFYGATEMSLVFSNNLNLDCTMGAATGKYEICQFDVEEEQLLRDENGFLKRVGPNEPGLLIFPLEGSNQFSGYTDQEATRKKLIKHAFRKGDVWCNTGDLVRDIGFGHTQFVDRLGDTFRMKGENVSTTEVEKTLNIFSQINEATVYGVEAPGVEGKIGMACLTLNLSRESFDWNRFLQHLTKHHPRYALPVFLRITKELEKTSTFKIIKSKLKKEGFNINMIRDPVYVWLPGTDRYQPLTRELYENILKLTFKF